MKPEKKPDRKAKFPFSYVMILAVAMFAGWVYFFEFKGGQETEKRKSEAAALLPFSNSNVTLIELRALTPGAPSAGQKNETILRKSDDSWKVEKPYSDLGDAVAVDNFLATASGEKIGETVVEGRDIAWKTYGLDLPSAEASFVAKVDGQEKTRKIKVGTVPAFDGSVYVRIDEAARVQLMSSTVLAVLQKEARDFRDKRFFPAATHPEFNSLSVTRQGSAPIRFESQDGVWIEPQAAAGAWPLDQANVKSYVQSVASLRGNDVWAEDKTDAKVVQMRKLERPGISISLTSPNGEAYSVKIAKLDAKESVTAAVSSARPLVFSVLKTTVESLSNPLDAFRDLRFPFQFTIAAVEAVELERPRGEVSLPMVLRKDGKWLIDPMDVNFQKRALKPGAVEKLLVDLDALKAKSVFVTGTPKSKLGAKGSVRVGLFALKSKKIAEFIFEPGGETVRVTSSKIPNRVFEIEKSQFEALVLDVAADLVTDPVADPPAGSVSPKGTP